MSDYKGILAELITTIFEYFQWNLLIFMVNGLFYKERETVVISRSVIPPTSGTEIKTKSNLTQKSLVAGQK